MSYGTSSFGAGSFGADSATIYALVSESALLSEVQSMLGDFSASQSEVLSLIETNNSFTVSGTGVAESVNLLDSTAAMTTYFLQVSEDGAILDYIDAGTVYTAILDDDATLSDWIAAGQLFSKVQDEVLNLSESADGTVTLALVTIMGTARVSDGPAPGSNRNLMNYYLLGSSVTLISSFSDLNGLPVEPVEVDIEILQPDDTKVLVGNDQITNLGGGTYTFSFQPPMAGIYFYRFTGQGTNSVVAEAYFLVQKSFN